MLLLHYDGSQWQPAPNSETRGQQVCAAGISDFSFYTVGYQDSKPAFAADAAGPALAHLQGITDASAPLPAVVVGDNPLDYRISPPLPEGLSFNPATRIIYGAPAATSPRTEYTLNAIDYDSPGTAWDDDTAALPFTIAVGPNLRPGFAPQSAVAPQVYAVGERVRLELPAATGGNGALTYRLSPRLPDGLHVDAADRAIAGIPTTSIPEPRRYTLTATDADGSFTTLTFTIQVLHLDTTPTFGSAAVPHQTYTATPATTPAATPTTPTAVPTVPAPQPTAIVSTPMPTSTPAAPAATTPTAAPAPTATAAPDPTPPAPPAGEDTGPGLLVPALIGAAILLAIAIAIAVAIVIIRRRAR